MPKNQLKMDPTRTTTLRRKFSTDLRRRFKILKQRLHKLIVEDDAFGLNPPPTPFALNAFCPTGPGGGRDNSCSSKDGGGGSEESSGGDDKFLSFDKTPSPSSPDQYTHAVRPRAKMDNATLEKHEKAFDKKLTSDERNALNEYTLSNDVNEELRTGNISPLGQEQADLMDRAIAKGKVPKDMHVHRVISVPEDVAGLQALEGNILRDAGYISTSVSEETYRAIASDRADETDDNLGYRSHYVRMTILLPRGAEAGMLSGEGSEHEVLLPRNAPIKIHSVRRIGNPQELIGGRPTYHVTAEYIPQSQVRNTRWRFATSRDKVRQFEAWLRQQYDSLFLGATEEQLWEQFIEDGFRQGAGRAFDDTRRPQRAAARGRGRLEFYQGTRDEFMRSAFGRPEAIDKIKLLAGRTLTDIVGVTDDVAVRMSRVLVEGLTRGENPRTIARGLNGPLGRGASAAERVARTEIIRAHAEGQLEALGQLGVEEVGVAVEWSTANDDRVCPLCESLEGVVLKLDEARGMLPRHPNCRCAWIPANVGEKETIKEQVRPRSRINEAIDESIELEGRDTWGPGESIARRRPQSILNKGRTNATKTGLGYERIQGHDRPRINNLGRAWLCSRVRQSYLGGCTK